MMMICLALDWSALVILFVFSTKICSLWIWVGFPGGRIDGRRINCLWTKLERQTTNPRNETCWVSTKAHVVTLTLNWLRKMIRISLKGFLLSGNCLKESDQSIYFVRTCHWMWKEVEWSSEKPFLLHKRCPVTTTHSFLCITKPVSSKSFREFTTHPVLRASISRGGKEEPQGEALPRQSIVSTKEWEWSGLSGNVIPDPFHRKNGFGWPGYIFGAIFGTSYWLKWSGLMKRQKPFPSNSDGTVFLTVACVFISDTKSLCIFFAVVLRRFFW